MIECLIIGDSIAVGIHQNRQECIRHAQIGITSQNWNKKFSNINLSANTVIISLGTNDYNFVDSKYQLNQLRKKISAKTVIWIMPPIKPDVQLVVKNIAYEFNDTILTIEQLSGDKVHPTSREYKNLAEKTKIISW